MVSVLWPPTCLAGLSCFGSTSFSLSDLRGSIGFGSVSVSVYMANPAMWPCVCACSIHDQEELAAIKLQIREFGQTPRRLFVLPHPSRLTALPQGSPVDGMGEEEVRTVGATTEGLGRMDSSSSWGQSPIGTPSKEDHEWVYVSLPGEEVCSKTSDNAASVELGSTHSLELNHIKYSISLEHMQKVHRE